MKELNALLKTLEEDILKSFSFVTSIYLIGSFGRDEGTFIIENGRIQLFNDIDIIAIVKDDYPLNEVEIEKFANNYKLKLNIPYFDFGLVRQSDFLNAPKSIQTYDLKNGSKLLYGENLTNHLKIDQLDLTTFEFLRLILNRTAGVMTAIAPNASINYQIIQQYKALIAIGDSILFFHFKYYNSSYKGRLNKFSDNHEFIKNTYGKEIYDLVIKSYKRKLNWYENYEILSYNFLKTVLRLTLGRILNASNPDNTLLLFFNASTTELKLSWKILFKYFLKGLLKRKEPINSRLVLVSLIYTLRNEDNWLTNTFFRIYISKVFWSQYNTKETLDTNITNLWMRVCH